MAIPGVATQDVGKSYDIVIIGAGIQGLATAYELAKRGVGRIAVLDSSWPGGGASGRNGELIRSAFGSSEWIGLFDASLRRWHHLSAELDFNVLFSKAGYLLVASTPQQLENCRVNVETQRGNGLNTKVLQADEVLELVPALNPDAVTGAVFQADAGYAHHDAVVWAYARAAVRLGVEIHPGVEVRTITTAAQKVTGVNTDRGPIASGVVVNAAGAAAPALARTAGLTLPLDVARLEMLVTESLAPFLRPGLASLAVLGYCHQTSRGEFVGGTELPDHDLTQSLNGTYRALRDMAQKFTWLFPGLRHARILRHWAGLVSQSADISPLLGPAGYIDGLYLSCGWVYGFMGAPAAGQFLAETIDTGRVHPLICPFGLDRFERGALISESSLVISTSEKPEVA